MPIKKSTTKAAATEAVKTTTEEKKTEAAKAAEPVKAAKTPEKKQPVKRAAAKKAVAETVYLQYLGKEINKADLMKQVKDIWTKELKNKVGDMKSVTLYLKPEENKAYYVINEEVTGSIDM